MGSELVRQQFGANALKYASSPVHAKGASLGRLIELLEFSPDDVALDIASAAGHVAFAMAPHVKSVISSDLTPEMLEVGANLAQERNITNVTFEIANAQDLHFADNSFDIVTCRIAPHHFDNPAAFVKEMERVAKPGGTVAMVDNVVPDEADVAQFANDWEAKRDPSHVRCLSVNEWLDLFSNAGLELIHSELLAKPMGFSWWADNMAVPPEVRQELLAELADASQEVKTFLRPESLDSEQEAKFHLTEVILIARA